MWVSHRATSPFANPMRIDRCVCFRRTFAELREVAALTGAGTLEELQRQVEFGRRCKLCNPYVRRMLRTGEVSFGGIITEDDEPASPDRSV